MLLLKSQMQPQLILKANYCKEIFFSYFNFLFSSLLGIWEENAKPAPEQHWYGRDWAEGDG